MKILNTEQEEYHCHSLVFSDGMNTVDELVVYAGKIGLKKLVITDHSQADIEGDGLFKKTSRSISKRWKNVHNNVEVVFGVEGDLLNENGDICEDIQGIKSDFLILSFHPEAYLGDKNKLTEAFVKAIEKNHEKIKFIGHIYAYPDKVVLDVKKVIETANKYDIPFELNGRYISTGLDLIKMKDLKKMLEKADQIYVTSDAHTLNELRDGRKIGFEFLKKESFIE